MTRRLAFLFVVAVAAVGLAPHGAAAATTPTVLQTYRVVGTGDSILSTMSTQLTSIDRWWDLESGRQPALWGADHRYSTISLWPELLGRSRRGGWVVVEDQPVSSTFNTTPDEWRTVLRQIVDELPDDRCLLTFMPYWSPAVSRPHADAAVEMGVVTFEESRRQPCFGIIWWDQAAAAHPEFLLPDGVHPSPAGMTWLAGAVDLTVGFRR